MRNIACRMPACGANARSLRMTRYEEAELPLLRAWPDRFDEELLRSACSWADGMAEDVFVVVARDDDQLRRKLSDMGFGRAATGPDFDVMFLDRGRLTKWELLDLISGLEQSGRLWE